MSTLLRTSYIFFFRRVIIISHRGFSPCSVYTCTYMLIVFYVSVILIFHFHCWSCAQLTFVATLFVINGNIDVNVCDRQRRSRIQSERPARSRRNWRMMRSEGVWSRSTCSWYWRRRNCWRSVSRIVFICSSCITPATAEYRYDTIKKAIKIWYSLIKQRKTKHINRTPKLRQTSILIVCGIAWCMMYVQETEPPAFHIIHVIYTVYANELFVMQFGGQYNSAVIWQTAISAPM